MIRFLFAMLAVAWCAGGAALASSPESLDGLAERINVLEYQARESGVPLPPMPIPDQGAVQGKRIQVAQSAANLAVRVDRLETQMRQYTGQMEEMNFRIRQLQEQLKRFQEDSEFRFQDLEKGKGRRKSSSNTLNQPAAPSSQQTFEQLGTPPQTLGNLSQQRAPDNNLAENSIIGQQPASPQFNNGQQPSSGPIDLSAMLGGNVSGPSSQTNPAAPAIQNSSLTGDPATDYDVAYGFILRGDYPAGEAAFRQFAQAYPNDELAANANYWIGESRFQQGDYRGAIEVFLDAYSQFPQSQKAPDMLLRTGMSLHQINERDAACATYEELLSKFPNASSGVRQKVRAEMQSAKC
ncbi:tol-pal system protein YbgF [Cohaesibacter sp. ES.047]|uniref:tol-pal system protein YbgF n=1 Tax=Cohaesibacter sp. ES.047 TaxID=1798205 RepID=UPI000BB89210|nr:tol-pal system protein YbgF [Cohaesibacter sp. ES.047]SNY90984.1 tol-pal system protein YbgF [Cohaesibacter sp. ES.047]